MRKQRITPSFHNDRETQVQSARNIAQTWEQKVAEFEMEYAIKGEVTQDEAFATVQKYMKGKGKGKGVGKKGSILELYWK